MLQGLHLKKGGKIIKILNISTDDKIIIDIIKLHSASGVVRIRLSKYLRNYIGGINPGLKIQDDLAICPYKEGFTIKKLDKITKEDIVIDHTKVISGRSDRKVWVCRIPISICNKYKITDEDYLVVILENNILYLQKIEVA